jgi:hypothetical protein
LFFARGTLVVEILQGAEGVGGELAFRIRNSGEMGKGGIYGVSSSSEVEDIFADEHSRIVVLRASPLGGAVLCSFDIDKIGPRYNSAAASVTMRVPARWFAHFTSRRLFSKMSDPLIPLPTVEKLSDRVIRVLGGNPSQVSSSSRGCNPRSDREAVHAARFEFFTSQLYLTHS